MGIKKNLTLIELLISIIFILVAFFPLSAGISASLQTSVLIAKRSQALWRAQEKLDEIRYQLLKNGYYSVINTYAAPITEDLEEFSRTVTLTPYRLTAGIEVKISANQDSATAMGSDIVLKTVIAQ